MPQSDLAESGNRPAAICDEVLLNTVYKPFDIQFPTVYFTPVARDAFLEEDRAPAIAHGRFVQQPFFHGVYRQKLPLAKALNVSADMWPAVIPEAPPAPYNGDCPFCGKPFSGVDPAVDASWTARTRCCGNTLFSNPDDLPENCPIRWNAEITVPYRDGRTVTYPCYQPSNAALFFPAGIISNHIHLEVVSKILPMLEHRVVVDGDPGAARQLAIILDRLARIYANLPYTKCDAPLTFARYQDIPALLPPGCEHLAKIVKGNAEQTIGSADYQALIRKLNEAPIRKTEKRASFHPGALALQVAWGCVPEAWGVIAQHPEVAKLSADLYGGDMNAIKRNVMLMLMELNAGLRFTPCPGGNFAIGWFPEHIAMSVLLRDREQAKFVVDRLDSFIHNHHFGEGISHEGAFNYSAMMGACYEPWVAKTFFGVDFAERYAWYSVLARNGDYPVRSISNIESTHADEHAGFFCSVKLPPPDMLDYKRHKASQCFPTYGLTCLRAGDPGSRLEVIMTHQNPTMHTDPDRLGLQLFYEGVNLLPDIGYMTGKTNLSAVREMVGESKLRISQVPEKGRYGYNDTIENHCTAAINGNQFGLRGTTFERYFGGQDADSPDSMVQFVQVDGKPVFSEHADPVSVYNRQLVTLNLPNGRPVVLDVFRIDGGKRHDLFWHVPAEPPASTLGTPLDLPEDNLHEYYSAHADPKPGWGRQEDPFNRFYESRKWRYKDDTLELMTSPTAWDPRPDTAQMWNATWGIDPERYAPTLKAGRNQAWEQWSRLQQPVNLRIWGAMDGSEAEERILGAVGPWSAYCQGIGTLQFDEAFSYWIEHRQGTQDLSSTFTHVIEPHTARQGVLLESVDVIDGVRGPAGTGELQDGRAIRLETKDGTVAIAATTLGGGLYRGKEVRLEGRVGVVIPSANSAFLYDGTCLEAGGVKVELDDSWRLRLVGLRGDITGHMQESALFVESSRPIPTDGVLDGLMITVRHQTNNAHTSGYRIRQVTQASDRLYRIDLVGRPRFLDYKYRVEAYDEGSPRTVKADKTNIVAPNQPYLIGRKVRFPRTGFESAVASTEASGYRAYHHKSWTLATAPAPGQIREGDPMVIYAIQPGDTVVIPSFFACRKTRSGLTIKSSGNAKLTLPEGVRSLHLPAGVSISRSSLDKSTITVTPGLYK